MSFFDRKKIIKRRKHERKNNKIIIKEQIKDTKLKLEK